MLLKIAGISRSVYYYYIDKKDIDEKNKDIIEKSKKFTTRIKEGMVIAE